MKYYVIIWISSIIISTLIASYKDETIAGFVTGAIFGPLGILIVLADWYFFFGSILVVLGIIFLIALSFMLFEDDSGGTPLFYIIRDILIGVLLPIYVGIFLARIGKKVAAKKREKEEIYKLKRAQRRDSDQQTYPYIYKIGKHGNESLAVRYGIANQKKNVKEYWYYIKGGAKKRNPDRDIISYVDSNTIRLQKTNKVGDDRFEVQLTDHRNRRAIAIIEVGTEYVKTFYPLRDSWFNENLDLEQTLKGNGSFTLKELATFHVNRIVSRNQQN